MNPPLEARPCCDVSVVIPTKNSGRTIRSCIVSVLRERPGEIIVVDSSSKDDTLTILSKYPIRVIHDRSRSLAHQRQLGVEASKGSYIMFVDSDIVLEAGCIDELRDDLKMKGWGGVHAKILSAENASYWQRAVDEEFSTLENTIGQKRRIGTAAALFKKSVLQAHPFDVRLKESYEDVDLCRRLVNDNVTLGGSNAIVYHYHRREFQEFVRQRFRGGLGQARMGNKYRQRRVVTLLDPLVGALSRMLRSKGTRKIRLIPYWEFKGSAEFVGVLVGFHKLRYVNPPLPKSQGGTRYIDAYGR